MANLKELSVDTLTATIKTAGQYALEQLKDAVAKAREDVAQLAAAAASDVPGLTELAARAEIALVVERSFGSSQTSRYYQPSPDTVTEEFSLTHNGGWGGPIGRATFKPGRYRLLIFGVRIGDLDEKR